MNNVSGNPSLQEIPLRYSQDEIGAQVNAFDEDAALIADEHCDKNNYVEDETNKVKHFLYFLGLGLSLNETDEFDLVPKIINLKKINSQGEHDEASIDDHIRVWMKLAFIQDKAKKQIFSKIIIPILERFFSKNSSTKKYHCLVEKLIQENIQCEAVCELFVRKISALVQQGVYVENHSFTTAETNFTNKSMDWNNRSIRHLNSSFSLNHTLNSSIETTIASAFNYPLYSHLPSLCRDFRLIPLKIHCADFMHAIDASDFIKDTLCLEGHVIHFSRRGHLKNYTLELPAYCNISVPEGVNCLNPDITAYPYIQSTDLNITDWLLYSHEHSFDTIKMTPYSTEANCWAKWLKDNATKNEKTTNSLVNKTKLVSDNGTFIVEDSQRKLSYFNHLFVKGDISIEGYISNTITLTVNLLLNIPTILFEVKKLSHSKYNVERVKSVLMLISSLSLIISPIFALSGFCYLSSLGYFFSSLTTVLQSLINQKMNRDYLKKQTELFPLEPASQHLLSVITKKIQNSMISESISKTTTHSFYMILYLLEAFNLSHKNLKSFICFPLFFLNCINLISKDDSKNQKIKYNYTLMKNELKADFELSYLFQQYSFLLNDVFYEQYQELLTLGHENYLNNRVNYLNDKQELTFLKAFFLNNSAEEIAVIRNNIEEVLQRIYDYENVDLDSNDSDFHVADKRLNTMLRHIESNRLKDKAYCGRKRGVMYANNVFNNIILTIIKALAFDEGVKSDLIRPESSPTIKISIKDGANYSGFTKDEQSKLREILIL